MNLKRTLIYVVALLFIPAITNCKTNQSISMKSEKINFEDQHGKSIKGRKLIIQTTVNQSAEELWEGFKTTQLWIDLLNPQAKLNPVKKDFPKIWQKGRHYTFNLFMYGFIPFGKHHIIMKDIDHANYKLQTREYGFMVPHWDNYFELTPLTDSTCIAKDVLIISSMGMDGTVASYAKGVLKAKHKKLLKMSER